MADFPVLPDVASDASTDLSLDQVGMSNIALPIRLDIDQQSRSMPAKARITANVQNNQKGLHMSRMYAALLTLDQAPITYSTLAQCMTLALTQQQEVAATDLYLTLEAELLRQRPALHSQQSGWNRYPIKLQAHYNANTGLQMSLQVTVTYSSSCPASAALSRVALKDAFTQHFRTDTELTLSKVSEWLTHHGTLAIPHSQRSQAQVTVDIHEGPVPIAELIDLCETALGTPVQTYVKRKDEQQFAINNGQNPMFVEDASRRLMSALSDHGYTGQLSLAHYESLHGHDAIAQSSFSAREQ